MGHLFSEKILNLLAISKKMLLPKSKSCRNALYRHI